MMETKMPTKTEALAAFQAADDAWMAKLVALCGEDAQDLRYASIARGESGSPLRTAFDARSAAHDAWLVSQNCGPARA